MDPQSSKPVKSDMKASSNLIERLMTLARNSTKDSPSTSKSPKNSKKRPKFDQNSNTKLTTWLDQENRETKRRKKDREIERKLKPLDVVIKHEKKSKSDRNLKRNSSFEKYGVAVPSFEKIVADQKKFEAHKEKVKELDVFDDDILKRSLENDCLEVRKYTGVLLDCKNLSLEELNEGFRRHLETLSEIKEGREFSERHRRFHCTIQDFAPAKDLRCSSSLVVFTQEQKDHLLDLLRSELDPADKLTSYFFKVLLPELCLRIFMDEHKMSKTKAQKYLDERPID